MSKTPLVLGLVLAMAVGSVKRADADHGDGSDIGGGVVAAVFVFGATYVGVTLGMGMKDLASSEHSMGYGVAETLVHAPLTLLWGSALVDEISGDHGWDGHGKHKLGIGAMTALHAALVAHGIYVIAKGGTTKKKERNVPTQGQRQNQGPPGMFQVGRVTASVTPAPLQDGAGFGLSGSF
jgi:hypothetical protein